MRRRLAAFVAALALCASSAFPVAAARALPSQSGPNVNAPAANLPASPTDQSKVPHYYGPYPNWANSPQALADAVVTFKPASAAPVTIGNALQARAYATDEVGALAPAFAVLPSLLPAGTLTGFKVFNQATPGSATIASAGGTFHAYVLRPTGTLNQYTVVSDSGVLTVPALASAGVSETDTFAANVTVKAGDVLAFYGAGIPFDTTGADVVASPVATAPIATDTIVMGDPATFPIASSARTYSFAATVTPAAVDPGVGAEATANVNPATSGIDSVTITKPGSGYLVAPAVSIDAPGLTPTKATAHAVISPGVVSSVTVVESGFGFTAPVATVTGGGTPTTTAVLTPSGGVDNLTLVDGGANYVNPVIQIGIPDLPGGVQATASVTMSGGTITGVSIANAGSGYTKAPTVTILDGTTTIATAAQVTATINVLQIDVTTGGAGYDSVPTVTIADSNGGTGANATATAAVSVFGAVTSVVVDSPGSGYITPGIKKFVDTLPGTGEANKNDLGQYIPVATPDTTSYPGSDYYEIGLVQYRMKFHKDLPASLLRGYVQLSTAKVPGKHVQLFNENLDPNAAPTPIMLNGQPVYGVDNPHYLGPAIVATKNRAVRVVFRNLLPTGEAGNLFLPVDTTFMGAGEGPNTMMLDPNTSVPMDMTQNDKSVMDAVRNPACGQTPKMVDQMSGKVGCYTENRATIHLHGGITPWISDGTPHQWITPAGENTDYPQGVAVQNVPDMNLCAAADDGCQTFYYTNEQSARLLFYHDHAWGITRLNVYAGEAAPYLITDDTEKSLVSNGLIPDAAHTKQLVIQDKTFVPDVTQMALEDPTWDYQKYGGYGNLWYEHVYMPAENPNDPSGMSAYGRWFYGPYFWPPATSKYGPIANPYYNMDPKTNFTTPLAKPCSLDDPTSWQYNVDPFCEPPTIPGTPNVSSGMEQFNDTPIVNGTAYPKTSVDPTAYRFQILNAANDRFWNLQWYVADPRTGTLSEVALDPVKLAAAQTDPNAFPTPDTKWSPAGPSWVQIGTEGGFLSAPAVIPNQPITWITDQTRFDFGNVDQHSLLLAPAERADVIVDFSQFRGKTLILYNDAPAAFPGRIPGYDYYTGGPDMTPGGAPSTLPGFGPNTRTIMRVDVSMAAPSVAFDRPNTTNDGLGRLQAAFAHHLDSNGNPAGVFETGQNPIIVGQAAYNGAYGSSFVSGSWCNDPNAAPGAKCDGLARISEQGGDTFKFDTLSGTQVSIPIQPKAIHDEMNSSTFDEYGRMTSNMGVEAPGATPLTQNIVLFPYVNPATEVFDESNGPDVFNVTPISTNTDGTQIWKITHNGVDTHPIHFHLYDIQVINRVTWDNIILQPDPNELGWKDTVRVSPLEDTYVAVRPIVPKVPFGVPDSHRVLNPMMPEGARGSVAGQVMGPNGTAGIEAGFNNTDVNGNPIDPIINAMTDFGWEYVWHCHILSHEEMDMMRPQVVNVPFALADAPVLSGGLGTGGPTLSWTDGTPITYANNNFTNWGSPKGEVGYRVERAPVVDGVVGAFTKIADLPANTTTYTDASAPAEVTQYRVIAWNEAGDSVSNTVSLTSPILTITASSATMTYGGAVPAITPSYTGFVNGDTAATAFTTPPTCTTTATSASPVGTYPTICSGAVAPNYAISYVAGSITITPAALTITASSPSMSYGAKVPAITPLYSAFVAGDTAATAFTTAPVCTTTATSASPVGTYPTSCSGAVAPNYTLSYVPGTLTIGPAALTITASSATMTYGGAVPTITPIYSGFVNGDTAATALTTAPTCSTTATSSSPVGSYPSTCAGAVSASYTITYVPGTVTVARAALTITASSATITYGGTVPAITPSYTGFVNGDTAATALTTAPVCSTSATSASPVGSYLTTCSGAVAPNYTVMYVTGTLTIGAAPLTITASSATTTYGGAVPAITPSYTGFVNGDTAAVLTTAPTCTTTATSASPVGTYPTSCAGAVAANYAITYVAGTVTVGAAPLTITASSASMVKGSAVPAINPIYAGFVNGDTIASAVTTAPLCTTTATSSSPAGTYPTTCSGAVVPNYAITYVAGTLTVLPTYTLSGTVTGANGTPLRAAYVHVYNATTGAYVTSLAAGGFGGTYSGVLPQGSYKLWIQPNTTGYTSTWYGGTSFAAATTVTLSANTTLNISLIPYWTLSGTVTTRQGAPLTAAVVYVYNATTGAYVTSLPASGAGATYSGTLPQGRYKLWIQPNAAGHTATWYGGNSFNSANTITLGSNRTINITIR